MKRNYIFALILALAMTVSVKAENRIYLIREVGTIPEIDGTCADLTIQKDGNNVNYTNWQAPFTGTGEFSATLTSGGFAFGAKLFGTAHEHSFDVINSDRSHWFLKIYLRQTNPNGVVDINFTGSGDYTNFTNQKYSFTPSGEWQELVIPLGDYAANGIAHGANNLPIAIRANASSGGTLNIVYAYFTDTPSARENPACDNCFTITL